MTILSEQFLPLYENLINQDISLLDIYRLRDAITAKLRNDGYILSSALIPAQTVKTGIVRINVVEGVINDIRFEGIDNLIDDRKGLMGRFVEKIKASRPLRAADLERYVLLMGDLPGVKVKTVLKPAPGTTIGSDLEVILERKPISADVTIDNRGTKSIGPYQINQSVTFNNLFGVFDQTVVRAIITPSIRELRYLDLTHTEQIGSEGTTILFGAKRSWSNPGDTLTHLDLHSLSSTLRVDVSHPFIRSRAETLRGDIGFDYKNSSTDTLGATLNEDRLRVLSFGASYDFADRFQGSNLFSFRISQGLDILDSTRSGSSNLSRAGGRSDFFKVTASVQHNHPLPDGFSLTIGADGQWSPNQLLSSEEFGVGGSQYGRAFDSSELTGDSGLAGKVELSYTPELSTASIKYAQPYIFTDFGTVDNYEDDPTRHGWQSISSSGVGVRVGLTDNLVGSFDIAKPIMRDTVANGDHDVRGFFSVTARY